MSEVCVISATVDDVKKHPNADRLEVATVGAYTTIVSKGDFKVGDLICFFPPDILIPEKIAIQLGVAKYLRSAVYPGDVSKTNCRVAAARLRGVPSFGFVIKLKEEIAAGVDLSARFHAVKYEPPEASWWNQSGDAAKEHPLFQKYTDIQNIRNARFKGAFETGVPVRVTEKVHGTNSRCGYINGEFLAGSHQMNKKELYNGEKSRSLYWGPMTEDMKSMLRYISETYGQNVIVFGEIFGSKIQQMDYGVEGSSGYKVFDISVNGTYLNWGDVESVCKRFSISTVPLLYSGPFYPQLIDELVDGPTTICIFEKIKCSFKGREGIVITPLFEQWSDIMGGRLIAKAVSVDYLSCRRSDSH
jgi:RNA ligase (TIGR02306 family)